MPSFASAHFTCLADLTDIFIDFWFVDRRLARRRVEVHPARMAFQQYYPELVAEIVRAAPVTAES